MNEENERDWKKNKGNDDKIGRIGIIESLERKKYISEGNDREKKEKENDEGIIEGKRKMKERRDKKIEREIIREVEIEKGNWVEIGKEVEND